MGRKNLFGEYHNINILPRPEPKFIKGLERPKTPWDFKKSMFKDYKFDTKHILAECFEYDW